MGFLSGGETSPGPTITVDEGDLVNLTLVNEDLLVYHQFFVSYTGSTTPQPGDPTSPLINPGSPINFQFEANVSGTFTYYCYFHPNPMNGTFVVNPAAVPPPLITILSPQNISYPINNLPLTFTLNETVAWSGYSLDSQNNVTISGNTTLSALTDGSHNVVVYANSTTGAMAASNTVYFTINPMLPNITQIVQSPAANVQPQVQVFVNATVNAPNGIKQVILNFTAGTGAWIVQNMTNLQGNIWNGTISGQAAGTTVTYIIMVQDNLDENVTSQHLGYNLQYQVVPEFTTTATLLTLMIVTLAAAIVYKKRCSPEQRHLFLHTTPA